MVVDEEVDVVKQLKSYLENDEYEIIDVKNRREAINRMETDKIIDLMLINTSKYSNDTNAFFSIKPKTKTDIDDVDNYLKKPFTKEQLIKFVNDKI